MYQILQIALDEEGRVAAYRNSEGQPLELARVLQKEGELLEQNWQVNSIVPIFRVNNYTEEWRLMGFALSVEEANKVVKALCWKDIEDYTFRYVAGSSFIDRIRVEDTVENIETI